MDYATIILQEQSTQNTDVTFSDSTGYFKFMEYNENKSYKLILQHLLYNTDTIYINTEIQQPLHIVLTPKHHLLNEIQVTAERPSTRLDGNTLSYDARVVRQNRAVTNAYEIVKVYKEVCVKKFSGRIEKAYGYIHMP